tara:strand:+ start:2093 stop:2491 length:399 start_codon:yes stop_codon:yes gene_type:complete
MDIGKAIYFILRNTTGVSNYVSARIFPQKVPYSETMPAITYFIIDTNPNNTKNGVSTYDYIRCQITSFGTTYAQAQDLATEIRNALDYKSGTFEGVEIDKCFFEDANDVFDDKFGDDGIHYVAMDFRFNINR